LESRAVTRWVHRAPPRARLVINLIRGKRVDQAIEILDNTPRRASEIIKRTLESAVANLVSREGSAHVKAEDLIVKTAFVDGGPMMKRFLTRAMGRATRIRKRLAHITIVVGEGEALAAHRPKPKAAAKPRAKAAATTEAVSGEAPKGAAKAKSRPGRGGSKHETKSAPKGASMGAPKGKSSGKRPGGTRKGSA
jgi:large subunit ribosomal protein L22